MQKYLVVFEEERTAKDMTYNTWGHTFARKKGEASTRARAKADGGKIRRIWVTEWRDSTATIEQVTGIVQGNSPPAVVYSILSNVRDVHGDFKIEKKKESSKPKAVAAPVPTKEVATLYHPPYEIVEAPANDLQEVISSD